MAETVCSFKTPLLKKLNEKMVQHLSEVGLANPFRNANFTGVLVSQDSYTFYHAEAEMNSIL